MSISRSQIVVVYTWNLCWQRNLSANRRFLYFDFVALCRSQMIRFPFVALGLCLTLATGVRESVLEDAVVRVRLPDSSVAEFKMDLCKTISCAPEITKWCISIFDGDDHDLVRGCSETMESQVSSRFDITRPVEHGNIHKEDMRVWLESTRQQESKLWGTSASPWEGTEVAAFVSSAPVMVPSPRCHRTKTLPVVGPNLYRAAGDDGLLRFRGATGEPSGPNGGLTIFLRVHQRSSTVAEKRLVIIAARRIWCRLS